MANGSPLSAPTTEALAAQAATFCLLTGVRVEDAATFAAEVVRTLGCAVDAAPIDHNLTSDDAIARVNRARVGSLVLADGAPLGVGNLPYLRALRNALHSFTDEVEREIARLDRTGGRCGA
jgi:hypothetical protein